MIVLVTDYYPPGGVHQLMAGHLLHYNAVHSIIHCLLLIAIDYIFVHFVDLIMLDNHLIVVHLLLNSSLIMLLLCTFVLPNYLCRIRFYFFIENPSSLFIFCTLYDDANLNLIPSFATLPAYQTDVWQKHDFLFLFFQSLFF